MISFLGESKIKLRTRALALFLTELTVAGLLPMSGFAIEAATEGNTTDMSTGTKWNSATNIKEILDNFLILCKYRGAD